MLPSTQTRNKHSFNSCAISGDTKFNHALPRALQRITNIQRLMINHTLPPKVSRGFTDLRASIFPPQSMVPSASPRLNRNKIGTPYESNDRGLTTTMQITNLEAVLSFRETVKNEQVSCLSTFYRTTVAGNQRITPKRLGSSFLGFMERFHSIDY